MHGLLPDPFPAPVSTRPRGFGDRVSEMLDGAMLRFPALARAATRRAGASMVAVTQYEFGVEAWRASAGTGAPVLCVGVGTGGYGAAWDGLPLDGGVPIRRADEGAAGVREVAIEVDAFELGAVRFGAP